MEMEDDTGSTRRDRRYGIVPGSGGVSFRDPRGTEATIHAKLERISVAGLAFRPSSPGLRLEVGMLLEDAVLRLGESELHGSIRVKAIPHAGAGPVGGLFYPATEQGELVLMALITGATTIEA
jgi:hypothetical protein